MSNDQITISGLSDDADIREFCSQSQKWAIFSTGQHYSFLIQRQLFVACLCLFVAFVFFGFDLVIFGDLHYTMKMAVVFFGIAVGAFVFMTLKHVRILKENLGACEKQMSRYHKFAIHLNEKESNSVLRHLLSSTVNILDETQRNLNKGGWQK